MWNQRPQVRAILSSALLFLLATVHESRAGSLHVNASAAATGSFGLEVTAGSNCILPEQVDLDSAIVHYDVTACSFITAIDTVVSGTVVFAAGISIALGNGFQVASGSDFSAGTDSTLTRLAFVTDASPNGESSYKASFELRLDDLMIGSGDKFGHFTGLSNDGVTQFEVWLKLNPILLEDRLTLASREDNGMVVETPWGDEVMLPGGFNLIELDWAAGAGTGHFRMSLNGVPFTSLETLDNDEARIDYVRWGITDGDVDGTTGSLDQDDFSSTR